MKSAFPGYSLSHQKLPYTNRRMQKPNKNQCISRTPLNRHIIHQHFCLDKYKRQFLCVVFQRCTDRKLLSCRRLDRHRIKIRRVSPEFQHKSSSTLLFAHTQFYRIFNIRCAQCLHIMVSCCAFVSGRH